MQVYSLYFSSKNGKIWTKNFFFKIPQFFIVYGLRKFQKCNKIKINSQKNFGQFLPKMQVYSLYFSSKNGKIWSKNFLFKLPQFFIVYGLRTFQKCKKIKINSQKSFGQFLPKMQVYSLYFSSKNDKIQTKNFFLTIP